MKAQTDDSATSMAGNLDAWPLADVLIWLHQGKRTAMVRIGYGLDAAVLFFDEGELLRCEWGSRGGEDALYDLLTVEDVPFAIIQREIPKAARNIFRTTSEVLLQLAVRLDEEAERHRVA